MSNLNQLRENLESMISERRLPQSTIDKALMRFNEHEMNIDSGDERPERGFDKILKLVDKANKRGTKSLTDKQAQALVDYTNGLVNLDAY